MFVEPKGENLIANDQWKEEFLLSLSTRPDVEVLAENEDVRLIGLKFYSNDGELKQQFREDFSQKILGEIQPQQMMLFGN